MTRLLSCMEAMLVLMFEEDFAQPVLPFDRLAATAYADIVAARQGITPATVTRSRPAPPTSLAPAPLDPP